MHRLQVLQNEVDHAVQAAREHLNTVLQAKGLGTYASTHEVSGSLREEVDELYRSLKQFRKGPHPEADIQLKHDLLDVAVVCMFAHACLEAELLEW